MQVYKCVCVDLRDLDRPLWFTVSACLLHWNWSLYQSCPNACAPTKRLYSFSESSLCKARLFLFVDPYIKPIIYDVITIFRQLCLCQGTNIFRCTVCCLWEYRLFLHFLSSLWRNERSVIVCSSTCLSKSAWLFLP